MQVRDVMTRDVVSVGTDTSATCAAAVMAQRDLAAPPVLDDDLGVVDIVRPRAGTP